MRRSSERGSAPSVAGPTPRLDLDLAVVRARHAELIAALTGVELCYAVKANPHPDVLGLLAAAGLSFDLASLGELDACLLAGARPERLSWGNPVKKPTDVRAAHRAGVSRFTTDAPDDVDLLAREAPGAAVSVRLAADDEGSATPFAGKFGADANEALALVRRARAAGLRVDGLGFHAGSQQRDRRAWDRGIELAARVVTRLRAEGEPVPTELNLGGGFPTEHAEGPVPTAASCAAAIHDALARHAPGWSPRLVAEPGRVLVADAGVLRSEVVLVAHRAGRRWVYLDVGRYQGLAETENEMIVYRLRTPGHDGPTGPVVLAGPTCDGDDVLYRHTEVRLPLDLAPGDVVEFLGAGAYTASYASVGFNGLPPLPTHVHDSDPWQRRRSAVTDVERQRWHSADTRVPEGRWELTTSQLTTPAVPQETPSPDGGSFAGRHVLAELRGIDPSVLADAARVTTALRAGLDRGGATVLDVVSHRFEPQGVTVVALLAESHASVHAYPEAGAAFVDVFTCGEQADPEAVVDALGAELGADEVRAQVVARGAGLAPDVTGAREVDEPLAAGMRRRWRIDQVLWRGRTEWQDMMVARTAQGVSLFCDGERQSTEETQLVYHEALAVPPMLLADRLRRVLVVGSSEGVVSQLAVAAGADHVDHVDIDAECVRRCSELLPYGYTADELAQAERGEGPVRMHYADGWQFLADAAGRGERYDVVVVDLPDEPVEVDDPAQHARLYGAPFLQRCAEVLAPGGVVCSQAGCPTVWRHDTLVRMTRRFDQVFATVLPYCSDEHEWAFLTGRPDPVDDPVAVAVSRLDRFPALASVDGPALVRGAILPHAVRTAR